MTLLYLTTLYFYVITRLENIYFTAFRNFVQLRFSLGRNKITANIQELRRYGSFSSKFFQRSSRPVIFQPDTASKSKFYCDAIKLCLLKSEDVYEIEQISHKLPSDDDVIELNFMQFLHLHDDVPFGRRYGIEHF
mmetsp:Transcript_30349/g.29249  ORF Transcript_30349/g.29249 Transcript_30349/m.29249 type:complete len:135 (-) Transcript_30349:63-467(-)